MNGLAVIWLMALLISGVFAFHVSINAVVDSTNEASSRIIGENFEWLLAVVYVLYFASSRAITGVWRATGAKGVLLYLWDCICVPLIVFFSLLAIVPAKFQIGYLSILWHKGALALLILFIVSNFMPATIGKALLESAPMEHLFESWQSSGAISLAFSKYPPKSPGDATPWFIWQFLSLAVLFVLGNFVFR